MIPFTQFMMPDGRQVENTIERPAEIEEKAKALINAGYRFEIEVLNTGEISMECCLGHASLASEICVNGPAVPLATDKMINEAYCAWVKLGRTPADDYWEQISNSI